MTDTSEYNEFVRLNNFVPQTREYLAIAFCGEAGEVANEVKKEMRPGSALHDRREMILLELGDTLYYLTALAKFYGYTLDQVIAANIEKLSARRLTTGVPA